MIYFRVKNFEKFQHYKNRNPPWIKFYNSVLSDYDIGCLQDASKAHLFLIWLLASQTNNRIPYDKEWIKGKIQALEDIDLDALKDMKFIEIIKDGRKHKSSKSLASCPQNDIPETERETEAEKRVKPPSTTTIFIDWYKQKHLELRGSKYVSGGAVKENTLVKEMLAELGTEELQVRAVKFLRDNAQWVNDGPGHTIGVFKSRINGYAKTALDTRPER